MNEKENNKLPEGVTLQDLKDKRKIAATQYSKAHKRAVKLDAADRGRIWEAVNVSVPKYQILPDTNHVSYVKNNILASIYTVGKSAKLLPTSKEDKDVIEQLNIVMDKLWSTLGVYRFQMQAGERAALLNYGLTQVGWANRVVNGKSDAFQFGDIVLKNIDPLKFMRDPFATSLDTASFCVLWDDYHESVIKSTKDYTEAFTKFLEGNPINSFETIVSETYSDKLQGTGNKKGYYRVFTYWVNVDGKIHEIHTVNDECILKVIEDIKPSVYPFAELYCNLPAGDLLGTSEPSKIFANSLAYNLLSSIILTAEYKNQRPPRFINGASNINVSTFVKHGNDADRTFVVQGDAAKSVHYHQFPTPSQQAMSIMNTLTNDVKSVTGVDDRYTGRDTGSVLTTGGIENMLDQVTMIDAPKVENYEDYCKRLTHLIIINFLEHSVTKQKYFIQDPKTHEWKTVEVDFPKISADTVFDYEMMISSELPKNKSRVEAMANKLMEMQMQYQGQGVDVDIITPEEWLMMQDLPMKEYMQERMGIQRTQNWTAVVSQVITQYAGLLTGGASPEDALAATADTIARQSQPGGKDAVQSQMNMMQQNGGIPQEAMMNL